MSIFSKLSSPFDPSVVSWRVGSTNKEKTKGLALAYIDARDVMNRLDEVIGPENWSDTYEYHGQTAICNLSIRMDKGWVSKADGAGDTNVEAEKGRISDAFKRAAVKWGIGRYLYDLDSPWVKIEPMGNSYKISKEELTKLHALLGKVKPNMSGPMMDWPEVKEEMELAVKEGRSVEQKPMPDDEYSTYRDIIAGAETMDQLKELFTGAVAKAKSYGDKPAIEGFTKIKDIRKAELERT